MRTLTSILLATALGLSSTAFAAEPTARDARMNDALKNYQAQKAGAPAQAKTAPLAKKQHLAKKPHATKKAHAKKHSAKKQHARTGKAQAPSVKATPATTK